MTNKKLTLKELELILNLSSPTIMKLIKSDKDFPVKKNKDGYIITLEKVGAWLDKYVHSKKINLLKIPQTYKRYKVYMDGNYPAIFYKNRNYHIHRLVWEEHNGNIPRNCIIHHKDGNKMNWDITNLELLTRSEHIKKHKDTVHRKGIKIFAKKGRIIKSFNSIHDAAIFCNTYYDAIKRCLKGKQKVSKRWQFFI